MERFLWKILLKFQETIIGRIFLSVIYGCGAVYLWNFFSYERDRRHPTKEMMQSKKYFEKEKERIQNNLKMLCDEESREVYLKCIKYRITHDYHDRPKYNRSNQYFPGDIINIHGGGYNKLC